MTQPTHLQLVHDRERTNVPPHDPSAEASVVSAVLFDPEAIGRVSDFLRPEHFFTEAHRRIFEAAMWLAGVDRVIDTVTIATRLRETDRLEQVGGMEFITGILDATPAPANVRTHAESVFDAWRMRQTIAIAQRTAAMGYLGVGSVQDFVAQSAFALAEIARRQPGIRDEANVDTVKRLHAEMIETTSQTVTVRQRGGIPTGIAPLDELTGGMHRGQKFTVVALPRVGKTALAVQVALHVARAGLGVRFFSAEMTRDELAVRQLAHLAMVDGKRIGRQRSKDTLGPEEWQAIARACSGLGALPITFDDEHSLTVEDVATRTRLQAAAADPRAPLSLVVVDYVQRLKPSQGLEKRSQPEQIAHATKGLKALAKDLGIVVLELAQQKDLEPDRKTGKRPAPRLGDVAWCKHVDKEADVSLYLHRPDENKGHEVTGSVVKQRSGEEGEFKLSFNRSTGSFSDWKIQPDRFHVEGVER